MIITISPAKILDFESPATIEKKTKPHFEKDADYLNDILKDLSANEIGTLMNINPKITSRFWCIHCFTSTSRKSEKAK